MTTLLRPSEPERRQNPRLSSAGTGGICCCDPRPQAILRQGAGPPNCSGQPSKSRHFVSNRNKIGRGEVGQKRKTNVQVPDTCRLPRNDLRSGVQPPGPRRQTTLNGAVVRPLFGLCPVGEYCHSTIGGGPLSQTVHSGDHSLCGDRIDRGGGTEVPGMTPDRPLGRRLLVKFN